MKNIVIFDLETTGTDTQKDKIIQIHIKKIDPELNLLGSKTWFFNPGMKIPEASTKIHGITDDDVKDKPFFSRNANVIKEVIKGCHLVTFNGNRFDIPLLSAEFDRCGLKEPWLPLEEEILFLDSYVVFAEDNKRDLPAAVKFYCPEYVFENAHDAESDVNATEAVFLAQLKKHGIEKLAEICDISDKVDLAMKMKTIDGVICWNFGKNVGKPVLADKSYVKWFLSKDFPLASKLVVEGLIAKEGK